jgi:hypothetical protein
MQRIIFLFLICFSINTQAQFLPDNKTLNTQSLERWMKSASEMAVIVELIDSMHTSDEDLKQFDELTVVEQDQKIQLFLTQKDQWTIAEQIAKKHGWKSPGEFRRFSTKLGNAIAAYFSKKDQEGLTPDQIKQLQEKMDPVILAVPDADIEFVQKNEKQLQKYIQGYGK